MPNTTDRYIMGIVNNLENLTGTLSSPENITGHLSNAILRGESVELRAIDGVIQYKYESDTTWTDLMDFNDIDYETLSNLPTLKGVDIKGEIGSRVITPSDALTNLEIEELLENSL